MASGQTTFGGVEQPATGENLNVWGPLVNKMIQRSIEMGAGFKTISLTGNKTLTTTLYDANESRWGCIEFTDGGLSSQPTVTFPAETRYWLIINSGSTYSVACKASGSAVAAVTVEASSWAWIYSDGTDMFVRDLSSMSGKLGLSSIADMASGNVLGNLSGSTAGPSLITVRDEDNMSSDDATGLATQQSIKAYVDTEVATVVSDAGAAAAASASAAATSASNASTSETNAASSASAASTSATNAGNSATAAATSASDAADSATDAANSAASAASKIEGPASATDSALVQFDGTTGKLAKNGPSIGGGANQIPQLNGSGFLDVSNGGTGAGTFTDGGVLVGNGTGVVQSTTAGTSGQVLTSNGPGVDPTFQDAAGGGMEQIGSPAVISSPVASVEFTGIPSTYDHLYISIEGVSPSSSSVYLRIAISNDNGSTYNTPEDLSSVTSVASQSFYGGVVLFGYKSDAGVATIAGKPSLASPDIEQSSKRPSHWRADGGIDAIQFTWSSGNFDAGTITLYGY
jgi:hypothetical protein